jgi:hypothetical protein
MNKGKVLLILGIFILIALIAVIVAADDIDRGTRSPDPTYVGSPSDNCAGGCHDIKVANWSETDHGEDHSNVYGRNKYNGSCAPCHVVGYDETDIGGFNSSQEYNSTYNEMLLGIQCENCHGPASEHNDQDQFNVIKRREHINMDRSPYTACWGFGESKCHSGARQFGYETGLPGWNQSKHAPFDNDPEEDHGLNKYCAECKSPSQYESSVTYSNKDLPENQIDISIWRGITCADCHNPHNVTAYDHQLKWDPEEICDVCHHETRHESIRTGHFEKEPSVNIVDYSYMDDVECVDCHMYNTEHGMPEEYTILGHSFEATIEACVWCHTDVYEEVPREEDDDIKDLNTTTQAEWDAWNSTLQEALDEWGGVVENQKNRYEEQHLEAKSLYENATTLKEIAVGNGTWTDDMNTSYNQAEYDFGLAEHNNEGTHNPYYTTALFEAAGDAFEEIIENLSVGKLRGRVTDESEAGLADVYISVNGIGTKTYLDGTYELELKPGNYNVSAFKIGTIEDERTDVGISKAVITWQNFTLADDFDNDGTPDSTDTDDDNDGMPDVWETNNSLDPKDPTDADDDDDNDGLTNLQEYNDGLDPQLPDREEGEKDETDTTLYILIIVVLIVVIVLLAVIMVRKGGASKSHSSEK